MRIGLGQYETSTGVPIDTSKITIAPSSSVSYQTEQAALDQLPIFSPTLSSEASGIATEEAAYLANQPTPAGVPSTCPTGWTCSMFSSIPDAFVYAGIGLVGLVIFASVIGGRRR